MPEEDVIDVPAIGEGLCVHNLFRASQDFLDGLLAASGASSVKTKLEADRTLGG